MTKILRNSILGPVNYRPLRELGRPGLIVEPPKHPTSIARIRVAIPAQLKAVENFLSRKVWGFPIPPTKVQRCQKTQDMGNLMGAHSWSRLWQNTIAQTLEQRERSSWRRRTLMERPEGILVSDIGVSAAWRGAKSDVDFDIGDEIGNAV